ITSGNTATVNAPSGVTSGNLLVVGLMYDFGSTTITAPTGWTPVLQQGSTNVGMATFYHIAGGSEPPSYSFIFSNNPNWAIGISRITGAKTTNPINVSASTNTGTAVTAPSIMTTLPYTLVLAYYTNRNNGMYSPDGSTNEQYDEPNSTRPSNMLATFEQAGTGATGDKIATTSSGNWVGQQI